MAGGKMMWEIVKAYLKTLGRLRGARWISPRESGNDPECAVMEIDVDLTPDALNFVGAFIMGLSKFDKRVNTDHPIFIYLGEQSEARQDAEVTFTISLRRRPVTAAGQKIKTDIKPV